MLRWGGDEHNGEVMNAVAVIPQQHSPGRALTAVDVREHVNLVQEVMRAVMREGTHYGVIPGCKQPSLFKAGSEVLLSTFRIAVGVLVEDLSTPDCIRYRVRTVGTNQHSGVVVGEGIGECSSDEDKYRWRKAVSKAEFEAAPESRRRVKHGRDWTAMQVRTEPADVANTVLKMAKKRAQIDLTLTATAASDIFTQDIEDMPEELREREQEHAEPTAEEKAARRRAVHDVALAKHADAVRAIKEGIAAENWPAVVTNWDEIPQEDQMALWLAPSKGGCFTTAERDALTENMPKHRPQETTK
jgi:hypothetical protein